MADCCDEFTRSAILHRAAAEAGAGLPAIETGMPLPAGTGLTRRSFVARTAGLALAVYGASRLPLFDDGIAAAAAAPQQRVLVSVFLPGGADAISMLSPVGDPLLQKLRPTLALMGGAPFAEDPRLAWHPALAPLATLHAEGKVTTFPAIGYTSPDQSHFTSRHFWEVGATDANLRTGWLGRWLDRIGTDDNPLQGLSLDYQLQPSLATSRMPVASLASPTDYQFWSPGVWGEVEARMLETLGALGSHAHGKDQGLATAGAVTGQSQRLRQQLATLSGKDGITSPVPYPAGKSGFPKQLAGLAAMLGAGLPIRAVAVTAPGSYDTHAAQPQALTDGLTVTAATLLAFQRDLEARGLADRVLTLVWTEFGRRAAENGSQGTDHGAAGAAFLIGAHASGKLVGEFPGLGALDEHGNLKATSDFRGLYAGLLEQWLGTDAGAILPGAKQFQRPTLLK